MLPDGMVTQDLRREPRHPAGGTVVLEFENREIHARLIDLSTSGFRAAHGCHDLGAGSLVRFHHPGGSGQARAVWTRISAGSAESGFFIVT